jgi:uronate dehydrogenase
MTTAPPHTALRFKRLLLTGAAGALGTELRRRLPAWCNELRCSDLQRPADAPPAEHWQPTPLQDAAAVHALLEGVEAVVHLGGISTEQSWESICDANIVGLVNLYEAARQHGTRRIVFASSNHVTGFYRQDEVVTPRMPARPDGFYGLSKAFGENLAQLYWDRHGVETVSLRIGSSLPEPKDRRMLATWLSFDDLERLVLAALTAPVVGHTVVYGCSDNRTRWWDNTSASHLGFAPQDSSEVFRASLEARQPTIDIHSPVARYQGGVFVTQGPTFDPPRPGAPSGAPT